MKQRGLFKETAVLVGACGCLFAAFCLFHAPRFASGEGYVFFLGQSSSAGQVTSELPFLDKLRLFEVGGESTRYAGDCRAELERRFSAELRFTEEACGIVNYYYFSPQLGEGILLEGRTVNLHIAVGKETTAVGSPLIFGGY